MGCFVDHERVDYISNLPDAILCEILSYLPTKAAVKTSILSTKWKYIWTQVPALDFIDIRHYPIYVMPGYQQNMCMTNTLARVPLLNNASYLERFCFDFDLYRGPINIKSWLDAVKWREIREVSMELYRKELVQLPRQFLCGSKLVALKLDGFRIDDMPPSFHLPSLETVHFGEYIAFPGDQFLQRFLLGCPVLKELFIHSMMGFDETVCIESLTLKSLDIRNVRGTSGDDLCISITTPNLRYLCLRVGQALYNIGDLNMLTEAVLYLWRAYDCRWDIGHNTSQLMKKVSGVRTLWFGITNDLPCQGRLPIFNNLTHLKLQDDRHITDLLRYTPNLKSLVLEHVSSAPAPDFDPEAAHECMSCLERVEFFLNKNSVLDTVEHFLKAATALKEMIINERGLVGTGRLGAVRQKIRSLPMASPICRIKFVD